MPKIQVVQSPTPPSAISRAGQLEIRIALVDDDVVFTDHLRILPEEITEGLVDDAGDRSEAPAIFEKTASARKTVMVVDDSAEVRFLVATILNSGPYQAIEAGDGLEALRIAAANRIDLLITDVEMPGMGGLELIEILKQRGAVQHCLVISGSSLDQVRELCQSDRDIQVLAKPFGAAQLLAAIDAMFNR